ncbi:hypothetical protein [Corynebacterium sp. 335C]
MEILIVVLAVALVAGGVVLLLADLRRRGASGGSSGRGKPAAAPETAGRGREDEPVAEAPAEPAELPAAERLRELPAEPERLAAFEPVAADAGEPEERDDVPSAAPVPAADGEPAPLAGEALEPEPVDEPETADDPELAGDPERADEPETASIPAPLPDEEPEPVPAPEIADGPGPEERLLPAHDDDADSRVFHPWDRGTRVEAPSAGGAHRRPEADAEPEAVEERVVDDEPVDDERPNVNQFVAAADGADDRRGRRELVDGVDEADDGPCADLLNPVQDEYPEEAPEADLPDAAGIDDADEAGADDGMDDADAVDADDAPEEAPAVVDARESVAPSMARHEPAARHGGIAGLVDRIRPSRHGRGARRAWAREINGEFSRTEPAPAAGWERTPEGAPRDVVTGFSHGRELRLADVGGRTVVALRRETGSDVVLEFARDRGDGLSLVEEVPGGSVASTDPVLVRRLLTAAEIDSVRRMPGCIDALWAEGEWAIALLADDSGPDDWDEALPAVAEFADVARRLPPSDGDRVLDPSTWDPTRPHAGDAPVDRGAAPAPAAAGPMDRHLRAVPEHDAPEDVHDEDPVWRPAPVAPAEPVDMPTRSVGRRMGDGEFRDLGSDEGDAAGLPALGQDPDHQRSPRTGVRLRRTDGGPSGIFADGIADDDPDRAGDRDDNDHDDTDKEGTER